MHRVSLILVLAAIAVPAGALNISGFKDAPIARLTGEELRAFRTAG